jgi:hypothetical protein
VCCSEQQVCMLHARAALWPPPRMWGVGLWEEGCLKPSCWPDTILLTQDVGCLAGVLFLHSMSERAQLNASQ